jgi:asparagine synthase (glutamine-hydrolysing)
VHDLPRMLFALDEPQADPAPINSLYIANRARKMDIKVLLSGAGGDDVFSGYRRHYALLQESLWAWLPVSMRSALAQGSAMLPQRSSLSRRLSKAFSYADLNAQQRLISYFFWIRPEQSLALFTPDIRRQLQRERLCEPLRNSLSHNTSAVTPLNQMLYLEQKYFLVDHNFNYTDKTSMASGVEVRVPFLDPDLVRFANSLPANLKYRGRQGKWILKESLNGVLPDTVLKRKKTGFGAPLRAWLRGPLKSLVDDVLSESSVRRRGIFDFNAIAALVKADRENRIDAAYTIFSLICIEIWSRQYLDHVTPCVII